MTKPNRFENSYRDTVPLVGVETREFAQKTKVAKTAGKIGMNCDNCGLLYETYACWAKRTNHHFCSRACGNSFKKIEIRKKCAVCGEIFTVSPSDWFKYSTCSEQCMSNSRKVEYWKYELTEDKHPLAEASVGRRPVNARLNDEDVVKVRLDNRPQREIAKDYGVNQSAISKIKLRVTYAKVALTADEDDWR